MPVWEDDCRGLPMSLASSSIFVPANRTVARKHYSQPVAVWSSDNFQIHFRGEELRADTDRDVWLLLMHLARGREMSSDNKARVTFVANEFLLRLGWPNNGDSYKRLLECLSRLQFAQVKVTEMKNGRRGKRRATMSFISNFLEGERVESDGRAKVSVELDHIASQIFNSGFISIDQAKRKKVTGLLGQKIADLIAAHHDPFSIDLVDLKHLVGSEAKSLTSFKQTAKKAMDQLIEAGIVVRYVFDGSVLLVTQTVSEFHRGLPATVKAQLPPEISLEEFKMS